MADLIDRQALIEQMESDAEQMEDSIFKMAAYAAINDVKHQPAADAVEVQHGQWVHCDDGSLSWRCSVCGKHAYGNYAEVFSGEYHFCPNCGARMDGEKNG